MFLLSLMKVGTAFLFMIKHKLSVGPPIEMAFLLQKCANFGPEMNFGKVLAFDSLPLCIHKVFHNLKRTSILNYVKGAHREKLNQLTGILC